MPPARALAAAAPLALALLPACAQPDPAAKVETIYQNHCAACHGSEFEGGVGGNLADGIWKHGGTDDEIFRSIAKGNRDLGMEPWEGVLSPEQVRAMVVFLREKEAQTLAKQSPPPRPEPGKITRTQHHAYTVETVAEGLTTPWSIAFLPDGQLLVTERPGPLRLIRPDGSLHPDPIRDTPPVVHHGQGGMLEVAPHPDYPTNGWIYLGFADGSRNPDGKVRALTAVARGRIRDHRWTDQQWIYKDDPKFYTGSGVHFGTRFLFHDGFLFFVVGERGGMIEAQDLSRPNGKIFRLHDDGRIPADNPFVRQPGAIPGIWSYGHRNPQGLALDPRDQSIYATEHGPRGGDELNRILKGANYGWPVITHGMNYNGTPITGSTAREGMQQPVIHWTPSIAACGLTCYTGDAFPNWKFDLFAGGLRSQELRRIRIRGGRVIEQEIILKGLGQVRDVRTGPDGLLHIATNSPDRILRLRPARP